MARVLIAVGEASGDRLAADVLVRLRAERPGLEVRALAGPRLRALGVEVVARAEEVTGVGLVEAAGAATRAVGVLRRAEETIRSWRPDLVLTVDSPSLLLRLARRARALGVRTVHVVSPQVWAWRPGRVHRVASSCDRLLCLFPMEPDLYAGTGLDARFVGHPLLDRIRPADPPGDGSVLLAPGSRESEIRALWPVFREVGRRLAGRPLRISVAPTIDPRLLDGLDAERVEGMVPADAALVASGTATLELAALGVPMVVAYRVHPLTFAVGSRLVRGVRHLALPNVLAGEQIVPEHLQVLDPDVLTAELVALLEGGGDGQRARLAEVVEMLGGPGATERMVEAIGEMI